MTHLEAKCLYSCEPVKPDKLSASKIQWRAGMVERVPVLSSLGLEDHPLLKGPPGDGPTRWPPEAAGEPWGVTVLPTEMEAVALSTETRKETTLPSGPGIVAVMAAGAALWISKNPSWSFFSSI